MKCNLAVIKGDGIGPEVVTEAMKVLNTVGKIYGHEFDYEEILMGLNNNVEGFQLNPLGDHQYASVSVYQ